MRRILVIAGSDSSGGAGLEADQKVIAAHGCYAMTATTALTAQNTLGVQDIHEVPPTFVQKQIRACFEDIGVDVVKTGMLATAQMISMVTQTMRELEVPLLVVDPVMVATSGSKLLHDSAISILVNELLPITHLLTPNIPEANLILREAGEPEIDVNNLADLEKLAQSVRNLGPRYVLLKGGHGPLAADYSIAATEQEKSLVVNVLSSLESCELVELPYQSSKNTHGTGCSLASSVACFIANGLSISEAVRRGCRYVEAGIKTSVGFGNGSGPINHFHSLQILPFAPGGFIQYLLDRNDVKEAWHKYTHHEFVEGMGDGTLPPQLFKNYLIQDYLYLTHFARANALAGYKAKKIDDIAEAATIVLHIQREMELHIKECEAFDLTEDDLRCSEENQACTAYSRYVLDIGQSEDWFALQISLLPCLLGYFLIADRLSKLQDTRTMAQVNRYNTWIENYIAEDYVEAMKKGSSIVEKHAALQSPNRIEELVRIFIHATKMETGFWSMGMGMVPRD